MIKFNAEATNVPGGLFIKAPNWIIDQILQLQFNAKNCRIHFTVEREKIPRTTGERSQNKHIHGHLRDIAEFSGHTLSEMKEAMKWKAFDAGQYPGFWMSGKVYPKSEADLTTVEAGQFIEFLHQFAAEYGIILKEGDC